MSGPIDFGWTRHIAWEEDGDGIWEVDFLTKRPALPPGSDGGIGEFKREHTEVRVAHGHPARFTSWPYASYATIE